VRPTIRSIQLEILFTMAMKGRKTKANIRRGSDVNSDMRSALRRAHIFGACSPTVMWRSVMTAKAMPIETTGSQAAFAATENPIAPTSAMISTETAGSPRAPRIRLARVMPSWHADR